MGGLQSAFHKRWLRRAHAGPYLSIRDEPKPPKRGGSTPVKKPIKKHDTPKSPHKEHGPKGKGKQGGGLQNGIAGIFSGKNEGATVFSEAPPTDGFGVHIAGDGDKIKRGFDIYDVSSTSGIWEGEAEDSFYVTAPEKNSQGLLNRVIHAGAINRQDAVLVVYRGADNGIRQQVGKDYKFQPATNVQIHTDAGVVDLIDPDPAKVRLAVKLARAQTRNVKVTENPIMTRLMEKGTDY